jgi:hypothetical protein
MKIRYFTFLIALFLINGCAVYVPQPVDIPLIKKKGDVRIDAGYNYSYGREDTVASFGFHDTFTWGMTDFLAFQAYIYLDRLARAHLQGALGLFKNYQKNYVIELYGGYGYSQTSTEVFVKKYYYDYNLIFSQFNIGIADFGETPTDVGLGLKSGYLYHNFQKYDVEIDETPYIKNGWIVEPSFVLRWGSRKVKFSTKINYLWTDTIRKSYYNPFSISAGVNFYFSKSN